ncbi:MAG TPA: ABC transporter substrate-binding protein [Candidatus Saccharimonadales bacterium]|nr:ABC transporter substrate-binding protein [Candidatus Saccharimonadales bacterium]
MIDRTTRLRWRRRVRRSRRQVEDIGTQAEEQLDRHLFKRLNKFLNVRRFIAAWILFVLLLIAGVFMQIRGLGEHYLSAQPAPGGIYVEGVLGSFTNANPLYANNSVDSSVSRLVFASLLKYDQNHQLVGDLADSYSSDDRGSTYTVHLRPNLKWHDGQPLTADDVVFTYQSIQNPDAQSPFASSWRGINVTAKDPQTVVFVLPNALSAFPYSLTTGIVPKHLLAGIPITQLRSVSFNVTKPIGSGPFKWEAIEVKGQTPETREQQIALLPFEDYHAGKPKLGKFIIRSFHNEANMTQSFKNNELNGMAGLNDTPEGLKDDINIYEHNIPLLSEVLVFLKNSNEILQDVKVRQALTRATNTAQVITALGHPVIPAKEPLLQSQVGYDKTLQELNYDPAQAKVLLDAAGWKVGAGGVRYKDGKKLTIKIYAQNNSEYTKVTNTLQKQWQAVGVDAQVLLQSDTDLQSAVGFHSYDALVYGISIGVDPDVLAYWHSSQADINSAHLNLSEYKSQAADKALEAGRTRTDPAIRAVKYHPFLQAWHDDAPAIALYQPRFLYITRGQVFNFKPVSMVGGPDRYANVENWMIHEERAAE